MFTPQRKSPWTPLNPPPQSSSRTEPKPKPKPIPNSRTPQLTSSKAKTVSFFDAPPTAYTPPPTSSLSISENGGFDENNDSDDWKRFKEVGLLDEASLEKKDRQATLEKLSRLQSELFDYQYNMGLLLIEKQNLASKTEELGQEVSEAMEILKRERAAHLIVVSEAEKREENLKKALNVERKSLADLERALHDVHEERVKTKTTSDTTVAELNARMEELLKQTLDVKEKSYSVEAKLAELDRKNSELDRKLQDLEDRENILQREQSSLSRERESHELYFRKQKEDLIEWERKLEEGEQRLSESRRTLNEREEKLLEIDMSCKVKESDMVELQKKIDIANATLKKVENDTKNQLADLEIKEKNAEAMRTNLEARQKQLQEEEARLDKREKVELEKLLNEHQAILDAKMQEFEADLKQKRLLLEEELKSRKEAMVHKETDINHCEVKLGKREQALEKKTEKLKEKEKDTEMKNKALKEQEKFLKAEEKTLVAEKKQVDVEKENLESLKKEIEMLRDDVRKQELHIEEEQINLENAEKERLEYLRLQSSLKQEIENVRRQSEIVEKEVAELKLEREKFEKDWEALDEKRAVVDNELKTLAEKKANFENLRTTEEERLEKERTELEERLRQESESIRLQKESFEAMMEHEKVLLAEKAKNEHAHMCEDFEQQKQDLYNDMHKRRVEWGKVVEEKERTLEEMRLRDITTIKNLKEEAEKTREEMEIERQRMEKEKQELESNKKQLEETGIDISNDIKALDNLSKKLKKQRVQLVREKEHFGALIEKIKCCKTCGNSAQAFLNDGLQLPTVAGSSQISSFSHDAMDDIPLRDLNNSKSPLPGVDRDRQLGGQMSVLRKCASVIFKLSPKNSKEEPPHSEHLREQIVDDENVMAKAFASGEPGPANEKLNDAIQVTQSDVRENNVDNSQTAEFDVHSEAQSIEEPESSDLKSGRRKLGRRRGPGVRRTHSVKEVVEDAKAILRDDSVVKMEEQPKELVGVNVNNQETIIHADKARASSVRKRSRSQASKVTESEQDIDHSDGNADSVTTVSRRKRRQTVASALPTPGQKRYNLRRHAVATSSGKPGNEDELTRKDSNQAMQNPDETPTQSLDVAVESSSRLNLVQVSTTRSIEFSSDRCDGTANVAENHDDAVKSVEKKLSSEEVKAAEETTLSEEVNETSENIEDDSRSMVNENGDDEEDDEDDEDEDEDNHVGQASVGKKLWKFLTS